MARQIRKPKPQSLLPIFYPPAELYEPVLQIDITGQPPRKSNSRRIVFNKKTKKPRSIKSEKAMQYSEDFLKQVPGDMKVHLGSPTEPLFLHAVIYYTSNLPDLSVELVKDLMQKAEIISDDRYVKGEVLFFRVDKENPHTCLTLYRLKES